MTLNSNEAELLKLWSEQSDPSDAAKESIGIISCYLDSLESFQAPPPDLRLGPTEITA
jgi:hypothetical protein